MVGLREQAALDLVSILNDETGFSWEIVIRNPEGVCDTVRGLSTDISETIDPETGQAVSGRLASVAIALRDLEGLDCYEAFGDPQGIAASDSKPWVIIFLDILGKEHTFKVSESHPDRAIGIVTCILEAYNDEVAS